MVISNIHLQFILQAPAVFIHLPNPLNLWTVLAVLTPSPSLVASFFFFYILWHPCCWNIQTLEMAPPLTYWCWKLSIWLLPLLSILSVLCPNHIWNLSTSLYPTVSSLLKALSSIMWTIMAASELVSLTVVLTSSIYSLHCRLSGYS